jgi:hypothetical protein
MVVDERNEPVAGAKVTFGEQPDEGHKLPGVTVTTDAEGIFTAKITPHVKQRVLVEKGGAKGHLEGIRPLCGVGQLRLVLRKSGVSASEACISPTGE